MVGSDIHHSISNTFFQCFSGIIDRVCQKTTTVQIWWEQIESLYRIPKGPAIKKFMPLVMIIGAHDVLRNFWI